MLQIKNLIQMCDEVSPIITKKQSTPTNNCRVLLDEDLMRASTKAHDPRKHLLIDNPKSVQQMLNPFKYKRNASREVRNGRTVSQDYFSFDDISVNNLSINTMLPINHIPCQDKYESYLREIQSDGPDSIAYSSYVRRYPKVYNYLKGQQQNYTKEPKFIIQPKRKEKLRSQIKQVEISTKIYNDSSNGKGRRAAKSEYSNLPVVKEFSKLLKEHKKILTDKVIQEKLSKQNQEKLQKSLRGIYFKVVNDNIQKLS